jgi:predicted kinase
MVIIMRGASGSGKSTLARGLIASVRDQTQWINIDSLFDSKPPYTAAQIMSADDQFIGSDGVYRFDPSCLGDAHKSCMRMFCDYVSSWKNDGVIIVDNTNTTIGEIAPYARVASAYDHDVHIVDIQRSLESCVTNNIHGVPDSVVSRQISNMTKSSQLLHMYGKVLKISN